VPLGNRQPKVNATSLIRRGGSLSSALADELDFTNRVQDTRTACTCPGAHVTRLGGRARVPFRRVPRAATSAMRLQPRQVPPTMRTRPIPGTTA